MPRYASFTGTPYEARQNEIEQRRRLAQSLMQQSVEPLQGQMIGNLYAAPSPWLSLAKVLQSGLGAYQTEQAGKEEKALQERVGQDRAGALARALTMAQGTPGNMLEPAQPGDHSGALTELVARGDPYLAQVGPAILEQFKPQKFERVDLGSEWGLLDRAGNVVRRLPKSATPGEMLRETGAERRHATPSGSSLLSAETTLRGQDIGAATTRRGQEVTLRGQDLTDARAREALIQGKAPTGEMLTAAGYADRMTATEKIMQPIEEAGGRPGVIESGLAAVPAAGKMLSNVWRPEARQRYRQAQEDWVRAKLRKESGAVIADEEMDREIRVYFPQIGDSPGVIAQKRQAREVAARSMARSAGPRFQGGSQPGADVIDFNALP